VKFKTGDLQEDPPEFMAFCLVIFHLWDRTVFKNFSELRDLACVDDGNIIGRFSQELRFTLSFNPVFKSDENLVLNMGKTDPD
jgi:hypothetical protein